MKKIYSFCLLWCLAIVGFSQNVSDTIHVDHYDLHLNFTDFTNQTISGYADLTIVSKINNLSELTLDLEALTVDSVRVNNMNASYLYADKKLRVFHNASMDDTMIVRVYYHGHPIPDARWGGFHYSGAYCYNLGVAFTFQPHNFGRCWYPCLDVFTDKSTYTMHIHTEAGKMAVCGGVLTDSLTLDDGSRVWTWNLTEPIPTYLNSVAVGPYVLYADTFNGINGTIPIQIYTPSSTIHKVAGTFVHLKEMLRTYERLFGPYRWARVGYVAVNFSGGAMEHATNIAYPLAAINGTTANESLFGHELFHHWFGNLITCARAEEMWINEGITSYSEAITVENLYGNEAFRDYIRDVHRATLKNIAKDDGGYYALDAVPQEVTYGTHSYNKGSLVTHSLRYYMGDSLFFDAMRQLLNHYAYKNVSSEQLFTYLSQVSGMDLMDFYEGWVHQPGFLHFSIDSIIPVQNDRYRVYLHQKLHHATHFANNNKVDLTFVSQDRNLYTVPEVTFSGEYGVVELSLPFCPLFGVVDYYEKMMDATIDYTKNLVSSETFTGTDSRCVVKLDSYVDTVLVRVEHNLVMPEGREALPEGIHRMSDTHYWNVNMAYLPHGEAVPEGTLQFRYEGGVNNNDYALMEGYNPNNLKLLYRATLADPWRVIGSTRSGSPVAGSLKTEHLLSGQYCLAVGEPTAGLENYKSDIQVLLYPNPTREVLKIKVKGGKRYVQAQICDSVGNVIQTIPLLNNETLLNVSHLSSGIYYVRVKDTKGDMRSKSFVKI